MCHSKNEIKNEINDILGHDSALQCDAQPGTWANEMKFVMNPTPGAGLIDLLTCSPSHYHCAITAPPLPSPYGASSIRFSAAEFCPSFIQSRFSFSNGYD